MIAKKDELESGSVHAMHVDLSEDDRLAHLNLSDSVICAAIFNGNMTEEPKPILEETCIAGR